MADIDRFIKSGYTTGSSIPDSYYDDLKKYHPSYNNNPQMYNVATEYINAYNKTIGFVFPQPLPGEWSPEEVSFFKTFKFEDNGGVDTLVATDVPSPALVEYEIISATISLIRDRHANLMLQIRIEWEYNKNGVHDTFYTYWFWRPQ